MKTPAPERAAGRRKLATRKQALPDGSFPIPNASYLKKAIRAVGRTSSAKRPALARLIRKRGRQLNAWNIVKGSWADNTQSAKAMARALHGQLIELGFTPELAKAEVGATLAFMIHEFVNPVVGSSDGPQVTTLAGDSGKPKLSKASVHYRDATSTKRCCGTCSHMSGQSCDLVAGTINRNDVCDRYSAKGYASVTPAVELARGKKPAKQDPDNDGDDDATSSGDTDNDRAGKLSPVQRAAMKRMITKGIPADRAYKLASNIGVKKAA